MINICKNLYYWFLDYTYVVKEELSSFFSRSQPGPYRTTHGDPIILIPGIYENWRFLRPIAKIMNDHNYDVHVVDGLGYNSGTVEDMAKVVKKYIDSNNLKNVTIISHSKGGLIGKYLLFLIPDRHILKGLIALNAPFSGSKYAYLLPLKSLRIFTPTSTILTSLAMDRLSNKHIVSIYGQFDPHIPGGSKLEGAKNIQLNTYGHFRIINDPIVHNAILDNI